MALLCVCTGWRAAILAAPHLWMWAKIFAAPPSEAANISEPPFAWCVVEDARRVDTLNAQELLDAAALMSPLFWRVRLEGF